MRIEASVTELLRNFSDYVNRVVYRRERFVLLRGGKPVAELSPLPGGTRLGDLPAILDAVPRLPPEEAEAMAEDLDDARSTQGSPGDPWES